MLISKLLGERYQVVQVLSQGAFCQTYMVKDTNLADSPVCIVKHFLPSDRYSIPVEIRRRLFKREVAALEKLSNYDLVPHLLAHFEDNFEFYLVQEFIEGHLLGAELSPGYGWTESKVIQMLQEVLDILDFVHSHGLIHRDVKPTNIIRRKQDNRLVLIDFGAVKPIWDQLVVDQTKTPILIPTAQQTTIAIGTPGYMPNEQQRGKPRLNSDIYALGMIGIQALTGVHPTHLPEDANTGDVIWQDLAQVSTELTSVLNKMVHYHFQDRYKSAKEALLALEPLAHLYPSKQESAVSPLSVSKILEPQQPSLGQNNNSELRLSDDRSDTTIPGTLISPIQEPIGGRLKSQISLSEQKIPQFLANHASKSFSDNQTSTTTISIVPRKSALMIGLVAGVFSGLVLMLVSYWSLQIIAPTPKIENWQLQIPKKSP
ncbi:serine/threonine-protein kinase [Calothrix sp. PCC 7507]|uniref:serine/threonine-protein kinase n=1 Tax=Calothrix sp. PCC 7507 TaxID=99598 RepID=UPI00029EE0FF|nr:serine/threonine-protein kinase [Calothrix sp. PCC 7507]AFY36014.1 serine/threonine protein kinase [Calothrix sp. PCC 7507]